MKIGFIGAGKVGHSLGRYFSDSKLSLSGYYSKSKASTDSASEFTNSKAFASCNELIDNSDIIFITVPDGMIASVWNDIKKNYSKNPFDNAKLFCHCSGSLTSSTFENADDINAITCSLHPMYAIADRLNSYKSLSNAYLTFEGSDESYKFISSLLDSIPNTIGRVDANSKTLYHAACVFFSNLVVGLAKNGEDILRECGLDEEFAKNAWHALFLDNAKNIVSKGTTDALTGPAERGDISTISSHINKLESSTSEDILTTYCTLTRSIVEIAKQRQPERDYSDILSLLNSSLL